uniref:ULP_PROTEASE domain-containing protein n=1 Tax=Rhabditophanes sp. KR3021 TaxID=114890 RepID=A0AC35TFR5_9BILA
MSLESKDQMKNATNKSAKCEIQSMKIVLLNDAISPEFHNPCCKPISFLQFIANHLDNVLVNDAISSLISASNLYQASKDKMKFEVTRQGKKNLSTIYALEANKINDKANILFPNITSFETNPNLLKKWLIVKQYFLKNWTDEKTAKIISRADNSPLTTNCLEQFHSNLKKLARMGHNSSLYNFVAAPLYIDLDTSITICQLEMTEQDVSKKRNIKYPVLNDVLSHQPKLSQREVVAKRVEANENQKFEVTRQGKKNLSTIYALEANKINDKANKLFLNITSFETNPNLLKKWLIVKQYFLKNWTDEKTAKMISRADNSPLTTNCLEQFHSNLKKLARMGHNSSLYNFVAAPLYIDLDTSITICQLEMTEQDVSKKRNIKYPVLNDVLSHQPKLSQREVVAKRVEANEKYATNRDTLLYIDLDSSITICQLEMTEKDVSKKRNIKYPVLNDVLSHQPKLSQREVVAKRVEANEKYATNRDSDVFLNDIVVIEIDNNFAKKRKLISPLRNKNNNSPLKKKSKVSTKSLKEANNKLFQRRWFSDNDIETELPFVLNKYKQNNYTLMWDCCSSTTLGFMRLDSKVKNSYQKDWNEHFTGKHNKHFLIPNTGGITKGVHWFLLVIDTIQKTIIAYDSLDFVTIQHLTNIRTRLYDSKCIVGKFKCSIKEQIPKQKGGDDCGPFSLLCAKCLLENANEIHVSNRDIIELRKKYNKP